MDQPNPIIQQFIDKIKAEKTEGEANEFFANLIKLSATELYFAIMTQLTQEDLEAIEKIEDDKTADEEVKTRFKNRTGLTPEEFVQKVHEILAQNFVNPPLN